MKAPEEKSVEVKIGIPPAVTLKGTWRADQRSGDFVRATAEAAGVTAEDVLDRLQETDDGDGLSLLDRAMAAARLTADRRKIEMLGRVAAAAIAGDKAMIQRSAVLLPTLVDLEPPHIRVLIALNHRRNPAGPEAQSVEHLTAVLAEGDPALVGVLAAQLVARGAAVLAPANVALPPVPHYIITDMGQQLLTFLDAGQ